MALDLPPNPRILLVRLSALGDVICAMPVVTALRRHWPQAHIAWAVEHTNAAIAERHPDLDEAVVLPRKHLRNAWRRPWRVPGAIGDIRRILRDARGPGFDLVLDLQGNMKSGFVTGLSGGRIRVGHDRRFRKEIANALFTNHRVHPVPEGDATRHRAERDLGMLRAIGIPATFEPRPITIPDADAEAADAFLQTVPGTGPIVAIHPGTSAFGAFKRWAPDRFAALADRLVEARDARVIVSWGPDEEPLAHEVIAAMTTRATPFPPPRGLVFLAAVYERADLVVGCDSGPLHLAGLMDTATLTLFGPKDPNVYRPVGAHGEVVYKAVDCSPCTLRACDHVTCMRSMVVDDVAGPALRMLADRTEAG